MASDPVTFKGIILATSEYKEKDRMIRVLTRDMGVIQICAKGVSGKNTKLSFVSVPFSYCDFVVTVSHGFYYLKEGTVIYSNAGIMESLEAMAVAGHFSDCLQWSVMQSDNAKDAYELALYAYYALSDNNSSFLSCMIVFNWRLMWILGLASFASECAGLVKNNCKIRKRESEILDYIGTAPVKKIFTVKLEESDIRSLRMFTLEYMRIQFERNIPDPVMKLNLPI